MAFPLKEREDWPLHFLLETSKTECKICVDADTEKRAKNVIFAH